MPIAAVTGRADVMDSVHVGGLGGTYGGNPVACAAALATIAELERMTLAVRAQAIGERLRGRALEWQKQQPMIGDVRGLGAMVAIEFVKDRKTREPAKEFTVNLVKRCVENGVILIYAGTHSNVLRYRNGERGFRKKRLKCSQGGGRKKALAGEAAQRMAGVRRLEGADLLGEGV
jgi:4-aminobutyrate aminotransferase/(S)-3-amino-2-methylpropionate transaminase